MLYPKHVVRSVELQISIPRRRIERTKLTRCSRIYNVQIYSI